MLLGTWGEALETVEGLRRRMKQQEGVMDTPESPPATTGGLPSRGCGCGTGGRRLAQLLFSARELEGAGLGPL